MSRPESLNRTIRITTTILGVTLAIAGLHHGFFEALQGSRPTPGLGIYSIGPAHVRWEYGTDDAVTIIPNFLITGVAAMAVSLSIIVWSASGLTRRHGPSILLALFVVLTLVGGGIGHVPFFLVVCAYATRIRSPLSWWRRRLGPRMRAVSSRAWLPSLVTSSLLFLVALELSVLGYSPMRNEPDGLLVGIWSVLLVSWVLLSVAYVSAIARDLRPR